MTTPKGAITLAIEALETALPEIEQLIKTGKPSLSHGLILQSLTSLRALVADVPEGLGDAITAFQAGGVGVNCDQWNTIGKAATILADAVKTGE